MSISGEKCIARNNVLLASMDVDDLVKSTLGQD